MIRRIDDGQTNDGTRVTQVIPTRVDSLPPVPSPGVESDGPGVRRAPHPADLVDRVRRLLEVVPGERRLLPDFGCRVHRLSDPGLPEQRAVASALVEEAIARWLPDVPLGRADVVRVESGQIGVSLVVAGRRIDLEFSHRAETAIALSPCRGTRGRDDR